jgi:hypothetical protein
MLLLQGHLMGAARIKTDHSLLVRPLVLLRLHLGVLRHLEEAEEEEEEEVGAAQIKTDHSLLVRPLVLLLRTDRFFILLVLLF